MSLKDKLVSSFLAFELDADINSSIHEIRSKSIKDFEKIGFPDRKHEDWKYTPIKKVLNEDLKIFSKRRHLLDFEKLKDFFISGIESYKIVFVDGMYDPFGQKLLTMESISVFYQPFSIRKNILNY